jgi:hypothetical protein
MSQSHTSQSAPSSGRQKDTPDRHLSSAFFGAARSGGRSEPMKHIAAQTRSYSMRHHQQPLKYAISLFFLPILGPLCGFGQHREPADRRARVAFHTRPAVVPTRLLLWAAVALLVFGSGARAQMATFSPATTKADRAVVVSITPWGLRPNRIYLRPGRIALLIENRTPMQNLTVTVTQDGKAGAAMTSQHGPKTADIWHFVTVQPGEYRLRVSGLPSSWQCTLHVSAK